MREGGRKMMSGRAYRGGADPRTELIRDVEAAIWDLWQLRKEEELQFRQDSIDRALNLMCGARSYLLNEKAGIAKILWPSMRTCVNVTRKQIKKLRLMVGNGKKTKRKTIQRE
jgi:hypothetical protein